MDDAGFDQALIGSFFRQIDAHGWRDASLVRAAREAGLPLERVRSRFPGRSTVLWRFGVLADQAALAEADGDGALRDRLFGMIMRRIDVLQAHRAGVIALLRALPADPATAMCLSTASLRSMGWLLSAAGVSVRPGLLGLVRCKGLLAVWLWTVNAWQRDTSADLSATMAALDTALGRAERVAAWLPADCSSDSTPPRAAGSESPPSEPFEPPASPPI